MTCTTISRGVSLVREPIDAAMDASPFSRGIFTRAGRRLSMPNPGRVFLTCRYDANTETRHNDSHRIPPDRHTGAQQSVGLGPGSCYAGLHLAPCSIPEV